MGHNYWRQHLRKEFSHWFKEINMVWEGMKLLEKHKINNDAWVELSGGIWRWYTVFLNYSGRIQNLHMDTSSQPHHNLSAPLCTYLIPEMKLGSPTSFLVVLLYATLPHVCHLQIPPLSSTHASLFILCFFNNFIPSHTIFISLNQCENSFLRCWRQ